MQEQTAISCMVFAKKETWELLLKTGIEGRRTGLGFTALADMVAGLGMAIDSDEAINKVDTSINAHFSSRGGYEDEEDTITLTVN